jgi:hypothetical protein
MVDYGVTQGGTINGTLTLTAQNTTDTALRVIVAGDAQPGLTLRGDGRIQLGGRVTAPDVTAFRDGSTRLHTINTFLTEGDVQMDVAGRGLIIREGSNARMGVATLVGGTVTVANTSVTANTRIQVTVQSLGTVTTPKAVAVTARSVGTSFTLTSSDATDTSVVAWELKEPAT